MGRGLLCLRGHGLSSCLERLPSFEPKTTRDKFLRIAEFETGVQHLVVIEVPEPR